MQDSMKKNKVTNRIALSFLSLLILAYSTIIQFSIPSIVLCFGDDGHIAFEQSGQNFQCVDFEKDDDHSLDGDKNLAQQEDHCDPDRTQALFYLNPENPQVNEVSQQV